MDSDKGRPDHPRSNANGEGSVELGGPELSERAGVAVSTVRRMEHGSVVRQSTIAVIRSTLESAGVEFISENGVGIGVKMRTAPRRTNDGP